MCFHHFLLHSEPKFYFITPHRHLQPSPLKLTPFTYLQISNQVFLVAGGSGAYNNYVSSTEVLIEGGLAWNFQQSLPTERWSLRGISLPDTVIMTGNKTFFLLI